MTHTPGSTPLSLPSYPWTGEPVRHSRRDKRKGHHEGYVARTEQGPSIMWVWRMPGWAPPRLLARTAAHICRSLYSTPQPFYQGGSPPIQRRCPVAPRRCTWEDPYGGECTDTFVLSECGGVLTQFTSMSIRSSGRSTQYK